MKLFEGGPEAGGEAHDEINLAIETLEALKENGKTVEDVKWCGSKDYPISWKEFCIIAALTDYDNGFGGTEIARDLVIVGDNWWLERYEYDGSEYWDFKTLPITSLAINERIPPVFYGEYSETLKESIKRFEEAAWKK